MAGHYGHMPRGIAGTYRALRWSLQGLRSAWLHEASFRLEVVLAAILLPIALLIGTDGLEKAVLSTSILAVLALDDFTSAQAVWHAQVFR